MLNGFQVELANARAMVEKQELNTLELIKTQLAAEKEERARRKLSKPAMNQTVE